MRMETFIEYLNAERGRRISLAHAIGVNPAAISQWDGKVPVTRVAAVEAATGIPRHELRPDIFNIPSEAAQ